LSRESKKALPEIKLFEKWSMQGVEVADPGLQRYLTLRPAVIPHTGGRHEHKRFMKSSLNVVERLANNMMRHGKAGGKKAMATSVVRNALDIVSLKTGKNPLEVLLQAIQNSAPCEGTTRVSYGGIVYHQAVDIAPQRRLDLALRFIADGARNSAFSNPKTVDECLADEIIAAAQRDSKSYSIQKRDEMERVALSSR
jgi:small subunit ribosomal protein S7